ncbi:MAG: S8 family peptidase [Lachnospiraceae bacterium]
MMDECEEFSFSEQNEKLFERRLFGLSDLNAAEKLGVLKLRRQGYPNLTGHGKIFAIADTGIDYTHPVFRYGDGRSRILAIWDQTAEANTAEEKGGQAIQVPFGRVYTQEEINLALKSENPSQIVPETDEDGHGTFLTGLAAGNVMEEEEFTGMAPGADILVVKLRQADMCLKKFWFVAEETQAFEEDDIIAAVDFLIAFAQSRRQQMVICLGISSSQGDHNGNGRFALYLNLISQQVGRMVVLSGGNEGNAAHHFRSSSYERVAYQDVEVRVSNVKEGLYIEFWADAPDLYGIGFVSPTGEVIEKLPSRTSLRETISFVFEPTTIYVTYDRADPITGATLIRIRVVNPANGIWKLRIFQEKAYGDRFDLWMPITQFIQGEAVFLKPDPDTTITEPGNGAESMTVTAYSAGTGGIYLNSSRGFTRNNRVKPDLAAPGVNVLGPIRGGLYLARSGSSVAAALAAGIAVLLMEYNPAYTGVQIKNYLIRGAERDAGNYPNTEFGWGKINLYETLMSMRETT